MIAGARLAARAVDGGCSCAGRRDTVAAGADEGGGIVKRDEHSHRTGVVESVRCSTDSPHEY